jgi:hypothetical protein
MSSCVDLRPLCLISQGVCLGSGVGSGDMPSHEVAPAMESMNSLCTFLSCSTGMV